MSYHQQGYRPQNIKRKAASQPRTTAANGRKAPTRSARPANKRTASKRTANSREKTRHPFRMFFLLVFFAFLATAGVMGYRVYDEIGNVERGNTFYPGIYINDIELNGASWQTAYDYLINTAREELKDWAIVLKYGNEREWRITTDTLGILTALDTAVQEAVTKAYYTGRTGTIIDRYKTIIGLKTQPVKIYTANVDKNMTQIDGILSEIQNTVYRPSKDAIRTFDFNRNNPVVISQEENGQELDVASLKSEIIRMVNSMEAGTISVRLKPIIPAVTAASLENKIVRLANIYTPIARHSTEDRNKNVMRGIDAFHGMIIKPGEVVSFNACTGKRTLDNGYFEALEIANGSFEMGVGGGICQVSSTLYNAVIQAGLEVVSRTNHGIPITYVDMGADATVSDRGIDFKFKNNTGENIYIIAKFVTGDNKKDKRCMFQIYGRPDPHGYSYSLRHETVEEIPIPKPTKIPDYKQEHVNYLDETYEASKGQVGFKVNTYLMVRDPSGAVLEDKFLYTDVYKAQPPVILVGVERRP